MMSNGKDDPGSTGSAFKGYTAKDAKVEVSEKVPPPGPGVQQAALDGWPVGKQKPADNPMPQSPAEIQQPKAPPTAQTDTTPATKSPNASVAATEGAALPRGTVPNPSESPPAKAMAQQIEPKNLSVPAESTSPTTHRPNSASENVTQSAAAINMKTPAEAERTSATQDRTQASPPKDATSAPISNESDKKVAAPAIVTGSDDQSKTTTKAPVTPSEASEIKNKVDPPPAVAESKIDPSVNRSLDSAKEVGKDTTKPSLPEPGKDISQKEPVSKDGTEKSVGGRDDPRGHSQQIDKQSEIAAGRTSTQTEKSPIADGKADQKSLDGKAGAKVDAELLTMIDRPTAFDSTKGGRVAGAKTDRIPESPGDRAGTKVEATGQRPDASQRSPDARGDATGARAGDVKPGPGDKLTTSSERLQVPGGKLEVQVQGDVKLRLPHKDGQPELNLSDKAIQRDLSNGFGLIDKQQFREFVAQHKSLVDFVIEMPRRSFEALKDIVSNATDAPKSTQLREWAKDLTQTNEQPKTMLDRLHQVTVDNLLFWKRSEDRRDQQLLSQQSSNELIRRGEELYQSVMEVISNPISRILRAIVSMPPEPIEKNTKAEEIEKLLNAKFPEALEPNRKTLVPDHEDASESDTQQCDLANYFRILGELF